MILKYYFLIINEFKSTASGKQTFDLLQIVRNIASTLIKGLILIKKVHVLFRHTFKFNCLVIKRYDIPNIFTMHML